MKYTHFLQPHFLKKVMFFYSIRSRDLNEQLCKISTSFDFLENRKIAFYHLSRVFKNILKNCFFYVLVPR